MEILNVTNENIFDSIYSLCVMSNDGLSADMFCCEDYRFATIEITDKCKLEVITDILTKKDILFKVIDNKLIIRNVSSLKDFIKILNI